MDFGQFWEVCEESFKESCKEDSVSDLIDKIFLHLNLYKFLSEKDQISQEEKEKLKARLFGELLLTLTNLSMKDNINVFSALQKAYQFNQ